MNANANDTNKKPAVSFEDVLEAATRVEPYVHRTPVLTCKSLDRMLGAELHFKCENFQKVGAFKFRGACNAVFSLSEEEAARGVVTHSSGNHAAAVALAARKRGVPAYVVMPRNAPEVKKAAVAGYGAQIIFCEPTMTARETTAAEVIARMGATLVHSYDDPRVIAGQGTAALELLQEVQLLDVVMTPVGGGGLVGGTALAVSALSPGTIVVAGEPEGADDAYRSVQAGYIIPSVGPKTIADGLLTSLGENTFPIIQKHVQIVTVSEEAIITAMRHVWERMKVLIEPSSAVPVGVLLEKKIDLTGRRIGVILSGGNVDLDRLPW